MNFSKRDINKQLRNGEIIGAYVASSSRFNNNNSSGGSTLTGNYLPATANTDGTYTVDITKVTFNGNIVATGEVTAYGANSSATTGSSTSGTVTVYDGLDSTDALIALSANQGRVLKNLIDTMGGANINIVIDADSLANNQILVYNATTQQWENKNNEGISEISKLKDVSLSGLSNNQVLVYDSATSKWVNKDNAESSAVTTHINDTVKHITAAERTNWNNKLDKSIWDSAFYFDSAGNIRVKLNLIGEGEVTAYGSGSSTSSGAITIVDNLTSTLSDAALSANQGRVLKNLIDTMSGGGTIDVDLSDYYNKSEIDTKLDGKSPTSHTHNYASTVKLGSTSYNTSSNVISLPSYPTLSTLSGVSTTTFNSHSANTTLHITSTERTNWNAAYTNNHTHSNKNVLDGITSTKVSNWDKVYSDWNDVFTIDSAGNLKVKVNLIGQGEVSAYGNGSSSSSGAITIVDNLTSTLTDAALSANQGRVLKNLIDTMSGGGTIDIDLSDYYTKTETDTKLDGKSSTSHTHSDYSLTGHSHSISNITNLQSTLDGKSGTGHSHSNYSLTSHTHSAYATTTNFNSHSGNTTLHITAAERTAWNAKSDAHSHPYATTTNFNSHSGNTTLHITAAERTKWNAKSDAHSHPYATTTNFNSHSGNTTLHITAAERTKWNNKSDAHSHPYASSSHTHNYAGSSSAGGAATSANKVNSTLTFTGGTFSAKSFNGSTGVTVNVPTHTSHITNNSGFITTAATVTNADKLDGYHGSSANTASNYVLRGSSGQINVGSISSAGNISATGEITAHSDRRLKSNIKPLEDRGYVTPVTYEKDGKECIGFVAQDMQELYPELVTEDNNTEEQYLTVNYMQYTAVLQQQIIDLRREIEILKEIIKNK